MVTGLEKMIAMSNGRQSLDLGTAYQNSFNIGKIHI